MASNERPLEASPAVGLFHIHRYTWGKPSSEEWSRQATWRDQVTVMERLTAGARIPYTRVFQIGTCRCGSTKRREILK